MSRWIPLGKFLRGLTNEIAESNVEMQTTQRMAWAESAAFYKAQAEQDQSDEIKQIRSAVLSGWQNENQLAIKEVKLSFTLVERGIFSRLGSLLAHPFSESPSRYQLIPADNPDSIHNVEITFRENENGKWEYGTNQLNQSESDISAPIL